jgi:acetyltransferase
MMEQTTIYKALKGVRGRKPVDLDALAQLMVRFSELVAEQRWIKEIDINPLLATPDRLIALDARVVVHDKSVTKEHLPKLAIRPYPLKYVKAWTTPKGEAVNIRPIRPEDEPLLVKFHETLSDRSVYLRYLTNLDYSERVAHQRLARICFNDYDREMALVAECEDCNGGPEIMGVARLSKHHYRPEGQFTMLINDHFQGRGIGSELLKHLLDVARDEELERVTATMTSDNHAMQQTCKKLGFKLFHAEQGAMVNAVIEL